MFMISGRLVLWLDVSRRLLLLLFRKSNLWQLCLIFAPFVWWASCTRSLQNFWLTDWDLSSLRLSMIHSQLSLVVGRSLTSSLSPMKQLIGLEKRSKNYVCYNLILLKLMTACNGASWIIWWLRWGLEKMQKLDKKVYSISPIFCIDQWLSDMPIQHE